MSRLLTQLEARAKGAVYVSGLPLNVLTKDMAGVV